MITTLISDFGHGDNSVAVAKGILLQQNPHMQFVDISHDVPPYSLIRCSYLFKSAYTFFPENTVHVSLFDVMKQLPAVVLLTKINNQIIISADNGFIGYTFPESNAAIWKYQDSESPSFAAWLHHVARLIQDLEKHHFDFRTVKLEAYQSEIVVNPIQASVKENSVECHTLHVDRFGNVVVNITKEAFEAIRKDRAFTITIPKNPPLNTIVQNYDQVVEGMQFAIFNSAGFLEIGVKNASAADLLGLRVYEEGNMIYSTIKINFL
jgi:S-adenosylmethionine hydrolase